jgi:hypothetical protein
MWAGGTKPERSLMSCRSTATHPRRSTTEAVDRFKAEGERLRELARNMGVRRLPNLGGGSAD